MSAHCHSPACAKPFTSKISPEFWKLLHLSLTLSLNPAWTDLTQNQIYTYNPSLIKSNKRTSIKNQRKRKKRIFTRYLSLSNTPKSLSSDWTKAGNISVTFSRADVTLLQLTASPRLGVSLQRKKNRRRF